MVKAPLVVALFMVTLLYGSLGSHADGAQTIGLVERGPIHIFYPEDYTAANGITGGSGTEDDPYVISGWKIEAQNKSAIGIIVHFPTVISGNFLNSGVTAISTSGPESLSIRDNYLIGTGSGAKGLRASTPHLEVSQNMFVGGSSGIILATDKAEIVGNIFGDHFSTHITYLDRGHEEQGLRDVLLVEGNDFDVSGRWVVISANYASPFHSVNLIDARDNYWGHPDGPRFRSHLGCCFNVEDVEDPREGGGFVGPGVLAWPYESTPVQGAGPTWSP
ncbi:MAG: hypothetical protein KY455_02755 [Euryarchaeota archaeon]|nr:hypothetical protein [Euryarchaeota archaeon]